MFHRKGLIAALLALMIVVATVACSRQNVIPTTLEPTIPPASVEALAAPAQSRLSCLGREASAIQSKSIIDVGVGQLANRAGEHVGQLPLPANDRTFVRNAISIAGPLFRTFDEQQGATATGQIVTVPFSNAPITFIEGEIVLGQEVALTKAEIELYGTGPSGEVHAYQVTGQFYANNGSTHIDQTPPTPLVLRVVSAQNGFTAFKMLPSTYARADVVLSTSDPMSEAVQYMTNIGVARVLRSVAAQRFPEIAVHPSKGCVQGENKPFAAPAWPVTLKIANGGHLCAAWNAAAGSPLPAHDKLTLTLRQYAGTYTEVAPGQSAEVDGATAGKLICFVSPTDLSTTTVEVTLDDSQHHYARLGLARLGVDHVGAGLRAKP